VQGKKKSKEGDVNSTCRARKKASSDFHQTLHGVWRLRRRGVVATWGGGENGRKPILLGTQAVICFSDQTGGAGNQDSGLGGEGSAVSL